MTLSINTNIAATRASKYLAANHQNLQKSLDRLSSGKRITSASDDAGGLAVSMKLEHSINGLKGTANGISNGISMLQVMDGVLASAADIMARIGELKSMHSDVTKSTTDKDAYNNEAKDLIAQLQVLANSTDFNGIQLFNAAGTKKVNLDSNGTSVLSIDDTNFVSTTTTVVNSIVTGGSLDSPAATAAKITTALGQIATLRATNGGQVKRLEYALADANNQITNLTAANGRIMDVDIAEESAALARHQILVQASASMVAQANSANNVALQLLQ
jgi:flagellin